MALKKVYRSKEIGSVWRLTPHWTRKRSANPLEFRKKQHHLERVPENMKLRTSPWVLFEDLIGAGISVWIAPWNIFTLPCTQRWKNLKLRHEFALSERQLQAFSMEWAFLLKSLPTVDVEWLFCSRRFHGTLGVSAINSIRPIKFLVDADWEQVMVFKNKQPDSVYPTSARWTTPTSCLPQASFTTTLLEDHMWRFLQYENIS